MHVVTVVAFVTEYYLQWIKFQLQHRLICIITMVAVINVESRCYCTIASCHTCRVGKCVLLSTLTFRQCYVIPNEIRV